MSEYMYIVKSLMMKSRTLRYPCCLRMINYFIIYVYKHLCACGGN